jgi:SAM-dependent methyltransferase
MQASPAPLQGFAVLRRRSDVTRARQELRARRLSALSSPLARRLRRLGLLGGVDVGAEIKSWDVLRTVERIEQSLPRDAPVLDIGAFASELPGALRRAGYTNLAAIDLDPRIQEMPDAGAIRYVTGDFMATPFADASFSAVTAISVIEHGFDGPRLLGEIGRLLRPGGLFLASFDYWEEKIDTSGLTAFGMDWRIFSRDEVVAFQHEAEGYGLHTLGEAEFGCDERVVDWNGRRYTFAWIALRKAGG